MRAYLIHKNGVISEATNIGSGFSFEPKGTKRTHPNKEILEITEKEFDEIKHDLTQYKVVGKKVVKKSKSEIKKLGEEREKWQEENTVEGLKKKIKNLEKLAMVK